MLAWYGNRFLNIVFTPHTLKALVFFYYLEQQFTIPCMHAFVKDSQASVKMIVHASIFDCDAGIVAVGEEAEKRDARDFLLHIISGPNNRILCFEVYAMKH